MASGLERYTYDLKAWSAANVTMNRIVVRSLQRYWRMSRAMTLGAQGAVIDQHGQFLLVRHTYQPGWHFPGGGVEKGETIEQTMRREMLEEAGVIVTGKPELFGVYSNFKAFPGDHVALFVVRSWTQPRIPPRNAEIAEQRFFAHDAMPENLNPPTSRRIIEILGQKEISADW